MKPALYSALPPFSPLIDTTVRSSRTCSLFPWSFSYRPFFFRHGQLCRKDPTCGKLHSFIMNYFLFCPPGGFSRSGERRGPRCSMLSVEPLMNLFLSSLSMVLQSASLSVLRIMGLLLSFLLDTFFGVELFLAAFLLGSSHAVSCNKDGSPYGRCVPSQNFLALHRLFGGVWRVAEAFRQKIAFRASFWRILRGKDLLSPSSLSPLFPPSHLMSSIRGLPAPLRSFSFL